METKKFFIYFFLLWSENLFWGKISETVLQISSLGLFTHIILETLDFGEFSDSKLVW